MPTPSPLRPGYANPVPRFTHPSLPRPHALPLCAHAGGRRRDNAPTPSPLHPGYANPAPRPPAYAPRPTRTPSPFAAGGTVPRPVPSARLRKPRRPVYAPAPHARPPTVPSARTSPWPPPRFTHPAPPARPLSLRACRGRRRTGGTRAKGMRARRGATQAGEPHANRRVGAPKRGCERVTVRPRVRARGRVCERGGAQPGRSGGQTEGWAHQSGGAKRSRRQVTVRPRVRAKGEGV